MMGFFLKHCLDSIPAKSFFLPPSVMVTATQITNAKRKEMPQYYSIGWDVIMSLHGWFSFLILSSSFLFFWSFGMTWIKTRQKKCVLSNKRSRDTAIVFGTLNRFDIVCYTMNIWFVFQIEIYTFFRVYILQLLHFAIIQCVSCAKLLLNIFFAFFQFVSSCENIDFAKMGDFFVYDAIFRKGISHITLAIEFVFFFYQSSLQYSFCVLFFLLILLF